MRSLNIFLLFLLVALTACEEKIDISLDEGPSQLAVDGWVTNQRGPQTIRLTRTAGYFNAGLPPAATGATVTVTDDRGKVYAFTDGKNDGNYVWTPTKTDSVFGQVGRTYTLNIAFSGETYRAVSAMRPVPAVDSVTFVKQKLTPVSSEEGYLAEFYATDIPNSPDFYWIRAYQNGKRLDRTIDVSVSFNGAFTVNGADTDGLLFIRPIRQAINPEKLYQESDSVRVEVLSITADAFNFFQQLSTQINNGGLFASPPANVPTNVLNTRTAGPKAVGFFGVSAVGSKTVKVDKATIRPKS